MSPSSKKPGEGITWGNGSSPKRFCVIEGCGKKPWSKGWCRTHYENNVKFGDPTYIVPRFRSMEQFDDEQKQAYRELVEYLKSVVETLEEVERVKRLASIASSGESSRLLRSLKIRLDSVNEVRCFLYGQCLEVGIAHNHIAKAIGIAQNHFYRHYRDLCKDC